jgi:hypothetical protein
VIIVLLGGAVESVHKTFDPNSYACSVIKAQYVLHDNAKPTKVKEKYHKTFHRQHVNHQATF